MKLKYRKQITALSEKHIEVFLSSNFGKQENGESFIGFGIGPGWSDIAWDLHKKLLKEDPDYVIYQVKEKFGGLRYYVGIMTEQGYEYIQEAEELSLQTCEECGRPGALRRDMSWIRTLCNYDHKVAKINERLWVIQRTIYYFFFKKYFALRRWSKKLDAPK